MSPSGQSSISMSIFANKVNIIDVSLGGVRISYGEPLDLKPDEIVRTDLKIDERVYALEARILTTWEEEYEGAPRDLRFALRNSSA